jgi:hypothetical protein
VLGSFAAVNKFNAWRRRGGGVSGRNRDSGDGGGNSDGSRVVVCVCCCLLAGRGAGRGGGPLSCFVWSAGSMRDSCDDNIIDRRQLAS